MLEQACPWKEHLINVERERGIPEEGNMLYVLYPDETGESWRVQCVGKKPEGFENRKSLPERYVMAGERDVMFGSSWLQAGWLLILLGLFRSWRGHRDDTLSEIAKIPGCVFVHASG